MPLVASGRGLVVTIESGTDELTLIDRFAVAVWLAESATVTEKLKVPATVGVPEITPVDPLRVSPVGRAPTLLHV